MTALGDLEISEWREMITELIAYRGEQELQKQLYEWCAEHTPWLHGKSEITDYALECHAERLDMDADLINDNGGDGDLSIDINKVRLNLMRVRTKSSKDMGLVIPVWDYYGSEGPIEETIVLTINAIDGSMVSRELGY